MRHPCLLLLAVYIAFINATELTFELPDNEKQCFYEDLEQGVKFDIDFQVIDSFFFFAMLFFFFFFLSFASPGLLIIFHKHLLPWFCCLIRKC